MGTQYKARNKKRKMITAKIAQKGTKNPPACKKSKKNPIERAVFAIWGRGTDEPLSSLLKIIMMSVFIALAIFMFLVAASVTTAVFTLVDKIQWDIKTFIKLAFLGLSVFACAMFALFLLCLSFFVYKEKDRAFIVDYFSSMVALVALVVSLVALGGNGNISL